MELKKEPLVFYNEEVIYGLLKGKLDIDVEKTSIDNHMFFAFNMSGETFIISYIKSVDIWSISNGSRTLVSPFTGAHLDYEDRVVRFFNGTITNLKTNNEELNYSATLFKRSII